MIRITDKMRARSFSVVRRFGEMRPDAAGGGCSQASWDYTWAPDASTFVRAKSTLQKIASDAMAGSEGKYDLSCEHIRCQANGRALLARMTNMRLVEVLAPPGHDGEALQLRLWDGSAKSHEEYLLEVTYNPSLSKAALTDVAGVQLD